MSIVGHLCCLALATPTMTDDLKQVQAGILRIIGKSGNTTNAYVTDGGSEYADLLEAVEEYHDAGKPTVWYTIGMDEKRQEIPFTVVLEDVILVMLFPPPSNLALVPAGTSIIPPKGTRPA